ncbi:MAG: tRNA guanosine(34) transglycosylase Tgt [Candidatus Hydrothermarchaeales archaeon]
MYELIHEDEKSGARAGIINTKHGAVETPAFMPVATKGSVKTLSSEDLADIGVQALIANAFLLYLKPGVGVVENSGGLHEFMNWRKVIFTDSGGFQMLRKDFLVRVSKKGITFKSPFDNSRHLVTPEKCIQVQNALGSDVAMVLDDLPPYGSECERTAESVKRTIDWAKRCKDAHGSEEQGLFAIVQGGVFEDLRRECAGKLVELGFDGYGLGGLSIGEPKEKMFEIIERTPLPVEKARYLMGVGSPMELLESISRGMDLFDSAFPTRNARHNMVYTKKGRYDLSRGKYADDFTPLEEDCECQACRKYTRGYISHLLKVREFLGMRLVTVHNLYFLQKLMKDAREAIMRDEFVEFKSGLIDRVG